MARFHRLPCLVNRRTLEHDREEDANEPYRGKDAKGIDGIAKPFERAKDDIVRNQDGYLDGSDANCVAKLWPVLHLPWI